MIGVVDCDNFFVSCERVFRPQLRQKAVVVLSNNDGCVVARSNEAKKMGVKMGEPFFRLKSLEEQGLLVALSSNFELYGDMSRRVMGVVKRFVPRIEQYSIDECFIDIDGVESIELFGQQLSAIVKRWTGVPVSIGIASSKTLAKVASRFAKRYVGYKGCCVIDDEEKREKALRLTKVGDVWGIGRKYGERLRYCGVETAWDFLCWPESMVKKEFNKLGVATWRELKGESIVDLGQEKVKKTLTCSRTFKSQIYGRDELSQVLADFSSNVAGRLRREGLRAKCVSIFLATNRYRSDLPQYTASQSIYLDVATSDLREINKAVQTILRQIYREGYGFKKAGVTVSEVESGVFTQSLFDKVDRVKQERLLQTIDNIRAQEGDNAVRLAMQASVEKYMSHERRTFQYTTNILHIVKVK